MSVSSRTKAGCLITLLIGMSVGAGFALGLIVSKAIQKKKEDPVFWKGAAMKQLDKLQPTNEQRKKFEANTDKAVGELAVLREKAIRDVWEIVGRTVGEIQQELTPEQREKFEKLRPKPPETKEK